MLSILLVWLAALGPAYAASWKGCWSLLDLLLLPGSAALSGAASLGLGLVVGCPMVLLHQPLTSAAAGRPPLAALHQFVGLEVQVLLWRGCWLLLDAALGVGSLWSVGSGLLTAAVMAGTGCLPTAGASPPVPHRRPAKSAESAAESDHPAPAGAALPVLLPVLAGCVLVWHGLWGALAGWAPPDAPLGVTLALLAAATLAVALLAALPHRLGWVAGAEDGPGGLLPRLREDLLAALMTAAVVGYWKALFDLMGQLSVPDFPGLVDALLMLAGFAVVALAGHSAQTYTVGRVLWSDGGLRWLQPLRGEMDDQHDDVRLLHASDVR